MLRSRALLVSFYISADVIDRFLDLKEWLSYILRVVSYCTMYIAKTKMKVPYISYRNKLTIVGRLVQVFYNVILVVQSIDTIIVSKNIPPSHKLSAVIPIKWHVKSYLVVVHLHRVQENSKPLRNSKESGKGMSNQNI